MAVNTTDPSTSHGLHGLAQEFALRISLRKETSIWAGAYLSISQTSRRSHFRRNFASKALTTAAGTLGFGLVVIDCLSGPEAMCRPTGRKRQSDPAHHDSLTAHLPRVCQGRNALRSKTVVHSSMADGTEVTQSTIGSIPVRHPHLNAGALRAIRPRE